MSETLTAQKPIPPFPQEKHWLFGSGYLLQKDILGTVEQFINKYGDIFSLSVPFNRVAVISNPEFVRYVLMDNNKNYTKSLAYDLLKNLLGNGLLTSEGDFWKKQRRLIQPAFHRKKLEELTAMMIDRAQQSAVKFRKYAEKDEYFNLVPEMTALTLDVISKAIFSSGVDDEKARMVGRQITLLNEYTIEKLNQPIRLPAMFPTPFNIRERKAVQILDKIVYEIIDRRRKEGVSKGDLLSMLLDARDEETGESMDNVQLRDELMTIFIAGNETSSNALSWTLYLLSQNPDEEQKMIEEIDRKLDSGTELNFNTINEFHYVRQVLEESMRMFPAVWSVGRRTMEDDEIGGYRIPRLTNVLIPIIHFHRSPKYWQEPEKFDPERFAPEKRNNIDRFVYFPFGGGPRLCIGNHFAMLEMQIILIILYREFRFRLKEGFKVHPDPIVTLRPKYGMLMRACPIR
jgi:cytochrome P450